MNILKKTLTSLTLATLMFCSVNAIQSEIPATGTVVQIAQLGDNNNAGATPDFAAISANLANLTPAEKAQLQQRLAELLGQTTLFARIKAKFTKKNMLLVLIVTALAADAYYESGIFRTIADPAARYSLKALCALSTHGCNAAKATGSFLRNLPSNLRCFTKCFKTTYTDLMSNLKAQPGCTVTEGGGLFSKATTYTKPSYICNTERIKHTLSAIGNAATACWRHCINFGSNTCAAK